MQGTSVLPSGRLTQPRLTQLPTPTIQRHVLGMDIKEGLTWYLEKIHWDQAAIGQGGTAAGMQREL